MSSFLFQLEKSPSPLRRKPWQIFRAWVKDEFVLQKLHSPIGYLIFLVMAYAVSWLIGHHGWIAASRLIVAVVLIPCLIGAVFHTRFGLGILLIFSFIHPLFDRMRVDLPMGYFIDMAIWLLLFGILVKRSQAIHRIYYFEPIAFMILLWITFCFLELLNPWGPSAEAWAYAVRDIAEYTLLFFAALYGFRKLEHIQWMAGIWIVMATLGAIYGLVQEWAAFTEFEWNWLLEDYDHFESVYTADRLRKFSFFSGPASFGILMGITSLFCLILIIEAKLSLAIRIILGCCAILMLLGMLYSGTRTAFLILPAGFGFLMLLHLSKRLWISGLLMGVVASLLLWVLPIENASIERMKSAFRPQEAASFQVRMENQDYVQPYIMDHPIGGGVGSTGNWGEQFAPHTLLSMFPPDSGYVRIAVEMGSVGLAIYLLMMFAALAVGVRAFFRMKDPNLRAWLLAFLGVIFALVLANYPQQALTQLPIGFLFFYSLASVVRLKRLSAEHMHATPDLRT
ncbi:MAG: O-antigen ligase family protein [Bacteroidota bacterium]